MQPVDPSARFSRDVLWHVGSLAIAGACGVALNVLIGVVYGEGALGVFNQVFTFYLVSSQFAALGVHYSVLTQVAATDDAARRRVVVTAGLVATLGLGGATAALLWLGRGLGGAMVDSAEVGHGIGLVAPALLVFALNKVGFACLNGERRMRLYAVLYALRFAFLLLAFALFAWLEVDRAELPAMVTCSEGAIFVLLMPTIRRRIGRVPGGELSRWVSQHVRYGARGFMSGIFTELNTRIDIVLLGIFASDATVGAYSFAAILAEGAYQIIIALRTNYAPIVIREWTAGRAAALATLIRRARDRITLAALAVAALSVVGFVLVVPLLTSKPELAASWKYFAVLMAGMAASAGYGPFLPLLLYTGHPARHSILMLAIVGFNVVANVALISLLGPLGSALATALAFAFGVVLLRAMVARHLGMRI